MDTSFPTLDNPSLIPPKNLGRNRSNRSSSNERGRNERSNGRNERAERAERMEREKEEKKAKALSKASYPLNSSILQELIDNNVDKTLNLLGQFFQSSETDELMRKNLRGIINILSGKKDLCLRAIEKVEKIQNFDYDTDTSGSFFSIDTFLRYEDPQPIILGKSKDEPDKYKSFMVICDLFGITAEQCLGTSQYDLVLSDYENGSMSSHGSNIMVYEGSNTTPTPTVDSEAPGSDISAKYSKYYKNKKFNVGVVNKNALQYMESQSDVIKYWVLLGWLNKQLSHSGGSGSNSKSGDRQKGGDKKFDKRGDKDRRDKGDRGDRDRRDKSNRDDGEKKKTMPTITGPPVNLSDIIRSGSSFRTNILFSLQSKSNELIKKQDKKDKKKKTGSKKGGSSQVGGKSGKNGKSGDKGKGEGGEKKKNFDLNNNIENFKKFMIPCEESYTGVERYINKNIKNRLGEKIKDTPTMDNIRNTLLDPIVVYYLSYLSSRDSGANESDRELFNRYMIKSLDGMSKFHDYVDKGCDSYQNDIPDPKDPAKFLHKKDEPGRERKVVESYDQTFKNNKIHNDLDQYHFINIFKFLMDESINFQNIAIYFPDEYKPMNYLLKKDDSLSLAIDETIIRIVRALVGLIDMSVINMVGLTTRIFKDTYDGSIQIKRNMFGDLIGNGIIKDQMVPNLLGYYSYTYQRFDTFETELRERYREILEPPKKELPEPNRKRDNGREDGRGERGNRRNEKKTKNQEERDKRDEREPIYKNKSKTEKTFENKRDTRNRQANVIAKRNGSRSNDRGNGNRSVSSRNEKKYFINKTQSPYTRALKMISKLEGMNSKSQKISHFRRFKENDPKAFEEFKKNKILIQSLKNII